MIVGLISDTHGLLRPEVFPALEGVGLILHAGDVGGQDIIDELSAIAPVQAVYGNTDPPGTANLHGHVTLELERCSIHVSHGHEVGSPTPAKLLERYDADVIVYGHTHRQLVVQAQNRWVINPGAAGPRRFDLQPSVAKLTIANGRISIDLVPLAAAQVADS